MDVSRALLLPDLQEPTDGLLKTLSIYWDELVVPDYLERAVGPGETEFGEPSATFEALAEAGILDRREREVAIPENDSADLPTYFHPEVLEAAAGDEYFDRIMKWLILPMAEAIPRDAQIGPSGVKGYMKEHPETKEAGNRNVRESVSQYAAEHYLGRMQDAFELSTQHHLAPVARSPLSHVASIVGAPADTPRSEAALLSAAIEAFELDPDTPIDRILRFREKNKASMGRLRASLVDLSEGLRADENPTQMLSSARDVYRNRVVPALGDLEAVLKEGRIRFFFKSLVGATAIATSPVDPVHAVEGGATIMGQTLNYSFSRKKLIREHPFGFLHQVSAELPDGGNKPSTRTLAVTIAEPLEQVKKLIGADKDINAALKHFFLSLSLSEKEEEDR